MSSMVAPLGYAARPIRPGAAKGAMRAGAGGHKAGINAGTDEGA